MSFWLQKNDKCGEKQRGNVKEMDTSGKIINYRKKYSFNIKGKKINLNDQGFRTK
jgi:hypothetical protein